MRKMCRQRSDFTLNSVEITEAVRSTKRVKTLGPGELCMLNESLRSSIFASVWKDDLVPEINVYLDQLSHWFMENEEELSVGK